MQAVAGFLLDESLKNRNELRHNRPVICLPLLSSLVEGLWVGGAEILEIISGSGMRADFCVVYRIRITWIRIRFQPFAFF